MSYVTSLYIFICSYFLYIFTFICGDNFLFLFLENYVAMNVV